MKLKPLLIVLSLVSIITACNKNDDQPLPDPPTCEPLSVAAAKPGDTLYITGTNFSEAVAGNTVQINGVTATVVVASATELKVVIPANATSGAITVTVNGKTVEVGSITIVPFTLFVYKREYGDLDDSYLRQIYTIDPATGKQALFYTIQDTMGVYLEALTYVAATNEVVGLTNANRTLFRLNVTTKQASYIQLLQGFNGDFRDLVVDKGGNLYGLKRDFSDVDHKMQSIVKIDLKTGTWSALKTFEYNSYIISLAYLASSNEIVGLMDGNKRLLKFNLTTKDTSAVDLPVQNKDYVYELVVDNQSNLYGIKTVYDSGLGQVLKLNPATGAGTLLTTLGNDVYITENLVYLPQNNEIASMWNDGKKIALFKLNLDNKTSVTVPVADRILTVDYGELSCN